MNRREFIKTAVPVAAIPAIAITCKYEDDEKGALTGTTAPPSRLTWPYRVYCYEREQGEWCFSQNTRGSFSWQRELMTFEEEKTLPRYAGWMEGGKLHFSALDDARDFIDCHVRTKEDVNIVDSIYDIYHINHYDEGEGGVETQVAHYWFNGDSGRQIQWVKESPYRDYTKMEAS